MHMPRGRSFPGHADAPDTDRSSDTPARTLTALSGGRRRRAQRLDEIVREQPGDVVPAPPALGILETRSEPLDRIGDGAASGALAVEVAELPVELQDEAELAGGGGEAAV